MYYDSLMQGKGLIKRSKQIQIAGQTIYIIIAAALILLRFNLIAVVSAQALSVIIRRILAYRTVYSVEFKQQLQHSKAQAWKEILKPVYPNAVKVGLTGLGGFLVMRASIIMGSLYLSLDTVASYGITIQIIAIISSIAGVYFSAYQPQVVQNRIRNNNRAIKQLYLKSCMLLFCAFALGGVALVSLGEWTLEVIGSKTPLLPKTCTGVALLIYLLETNHGIAGGVLLTKNEVPYFKAALFSGAFTIILSLIFLKYTDSGVWGLILAQGIAQGCYQNWKWPMEVAKGLHIKGTDIYDCLCNGINMIQNKIIKTWLKHF
jgi:Na+-driven multidrug efflux pump